VSRSRLPVADGGFLQLDSGCRVTDNTTVRGKQQLVRVAGQPLDPGRIYMVVTDFLLLTGLNNNTALVEYAKAHPKIMANKDATVGCEAYISSFVMCGFGVKHSPVADCFLFLSSCCSFSLAALHIQYLVSYIFLACCVHGSQHTRQRVAVVIALPVCPNNEVALTHGTINWCSAC
jgi:hypothetical protein